MILIDVMRSTPEKHPFMQPTDHSARDNSTIPTEYPLPDAMKMPTAPMRVVVWHFSDLEFPPGGTSFRDAKVKPVGAQAISEFPAYAALMKWVGRRPDRWKGGILVVSGDFVSGGAVEGAVQKGDPDPVAARASYRKAAFGHAMAFVHELAVQLKREGDAGTVTIVCPGNQDVDLYAAAQSDSSGRLSEYEQALPDTYVTPGKRAHLEYLGTCFLTLDTTRLVGTRFDLPDSLGRRKRRLLRAQLDAALYDAGEIEQAINTLRGTNQAFKVEAGELLGIVVAHHPPTITPASWLEVKPFENAIGAGQAKERLARAGFRIFLHGHKHTAVAHEESIFPGLPDPGDRVLIFGAPAFMAAGNADRGFSVLEVLVSPDSGEARVLLHPHILDHNLPRSLPTRRFVLPPRGRSAAAVVRVSASVNVYGDCRLDTEFLEIPLPCDLTDASWGGWKQERGRWCRKFARFGRSDLDTPFGRPVVRSLTRDVTAAALQDESDGRGAYKVRVTALKGVTHASFAERLIFPSAIALSVAHQHRVTGTWSEIPSVGEGWEGLMHVLREPARRLELRVDFPHPLSHEIIVDVRAYVERCGELTEDPDLLEFTPTHPSSNFPGSRVSVSIENPMVGVAYVLRWSLPAGDALEQDGHEDLPNLAEACRTAAIGADEKNRSLYARWLQQEFERVLGQFTGERGIGVPSVSELRWSLYVLGTSFRELPNGGRRPSLNAACASAAVEPSWMEWAAGRGIAGQAYARRAVVEAVTPLSGRWSRNARGWEEIGGSMGYTGEHVQGAKHSVLYGIPVFAPGSARWVWGVFCVGTWALDSKLDLNVRVPDTGQRSALEAVQLMLADFSRYLSKV